MARFKQSLQNSNVTIDDKKAILDMTTTCLKNTGCHPFKYADDEQGLSNFRENALSYFEYLKTTDGNLENGNFIVPTIENFCIFLGISRNTLSVYRKRGGEWSAVIDYIKDCIFNCQMQLAATRKIDSTLTIWNGCNNHNYLSTNQFTAKTIDSVEESNSIDHATMESKMLELGLSWNEETKEWG